MDHHIDQAVLHLRREAARKLHVELRSRAMSDFWGALMTAVTAGNDRAGRAARRLAHRMRRHEALRRAGAEERA